MANTRKPLSLYAEHAGISVPGARKRLQRLGINYLGPFDFAEADRLFAETRHADRWASTNHTDVDDEDDEVDEETKKHPKFIHSQARREEFKANITELEYLRQIGQLIPVEEVKTEWFRLSRLVRDGMLNIPARIADQLAAETDQRKIHDLLEAEIYQALESTIAKDKQAA
jgi:phage terminase Nu1 subunit (DNA packaging protein)